MAGFAFAQFRFKFDNILFGFVLLSFAVPADATLVLIDKNSSFYLEEGDILEGGASANSDLTYTISYEELDDA